MRQSALVKMLATVIHYGYNKNLKGCCVLCDRLTEVVYVLIPFCAVNDKAVPRTVNKKKRMIIIWNSERHIFSQVI